MRRESALPGAMISRNRAKRQITEHVNAIQDNIRNLFAADAEDEELDEALEEDDGDVGMDVKNDVKTEVKEEVSTNIHTLAGAVPQDILNAAFAEDDEDPSDAGEEVMDPEEDK